MPTIQVADKPTLDNVKTSTDKLSNSTYGLEAIKTAISSLGGGGLVPYYLGSLSTGSVTNYKTNYYQRPSGDTTYEYYEVYCYERSNNSSGLATYPMYIYQIDSSYVDSNQSYPLYSKEYNIKFINTIKILTDKYDTDRMYLVYGYK